MTMYANRHCELTKQQLCIFMDCFTLYAMTMLADRHCEWALKNQTVKNDNVCQPSLRACEAIQKK